MVFSTLISTADLAKKLDRPDWAVVDCRFSLNDPEKGYQEYRTRHIPGAVYAHLDRDLSAALVPGKTGRHPLPDVGQCTRVFSELGIDENVQVVAYDDMGGAFAARLWWMLHWLGHERAAVLDGGWPGWNEEKRPVVEGEQRRGPRTFRPRIRNEGVADTSLVQEKTLDADYLIFDARGADRYRGENETIDPVAGHIPGALSVPFSGNLDHRGFFQAQPNLKERYQSLLGDIPPERVIVYCGSGVTAAHDILAMKHAGLGEAILYAGSWSEWITDPGRPIVKGPSVFGEDTRNSSD